MDRFKVGIVSKLLCKWYNFMMSIIDEDKLVEYKLLIYSSNL